jgi:hypothetical protein
MKLTDVASVLRRMRRNQLTLHCELGGREDCSTFCQTYHFVQMPEKPKPRRRGRAPPGHSPTQGSLD